MNITKLRSTLGFILAFLVAYGPEVVTWIGGMASSPQWLRDVAKGLGVLIGVLTSKDGVLFLNKLVPQSGTQAATPIYSARVPPAAIVLLFAALACASCKTTPTSPDAFFKQIVTCADSNQANPQAEQAALACLEDVVAGAYVGCLDGLVAGGTWTVDEIACIVRAYAVAEAKKVNRGTATAADTTALQNANAWLKAEQIGFMPTRVGP